jgi:N-acetylmuramoyl-L-alanine amidase
VLLAVLVVAAGAAAAVVWLVATPGGTKEPPGRSTASGAGAAKGQQAKGKAKGKAKATAGSTLPLAGKVVGIDPGHNGDSYTEPSVINALVFNGRTTEACDTTGTETDGGYTEAMFNFNVAQYLAADLRAEGAQVVLTRNSNDGVGPCVTQRAAIINDAHANAAVDIHADGGPATGRGFTVLEPVADGPNDGIIASSAQLAQDVRNDFATGTPMPLSTYDGTDGLQPRDDLAGLNLATERKVLIECGNMRNATDAALLVTPAFQQQAAHALAQALTTFLVAS